MIDVWRAILKRYFNEKTSIFNSWRSRSTQHFSWRGGSPSSATLFALHSHNLPELSVHQSQRQHCQCHHWGRTTAGPAHLDHVELALHGLPSAAPQLLLGRHPQSAMLVVDTLLQNYDDGGALGISGGIAKAIAGCAARLHRLLCPHGEMLG